MRVLEAVVLAGGEDKRLNPLTSRDRPKCLLPVANTPVLLYTLNALKNVGITSVIVVACGDVAASKVQKYVQKEPQVQGMSIKVVTAASESGSADAVRLVADKLSRDTVVVMSGDTITDIPLSTVLFNHRIRGAGITTVLSKSTASASANTKAGKTPKGVDYVAIDQRNQRLLSYAYDPQQLRRVSIPHAAIQACSSMTLTTDFRDACIYILSRPVIDLIKASSMSSIKVDVLPRIVNEQWTQGPSRTPVAASSFMLARMDNEMQEQAAQTLRALCPDYRFAVLENMQCGGSLFCGVYLAEPGSLCRRVHTIQSLLEVNRELANVDASGKSKANVKDMIHPTVDLGNKTVVGAGCIIGEHTSFGDKSSVKRSVIGPLCKMGSNVKILNSVVMEGCFIGDGAVLHNSVLGPNVSVGNKAQLKDCHVGHGYKIPEGADHRDEQLGGK